MPLTIRPAAAQPRPGTVHPDAQMARTTTRPGLSLILPAYNEADAIRHSIRAAVAALDELQVPYEVIVVDDGSSDETAALAREEAAQSPQVRVLSLEKNAGYGGALRHGFAAAQYDFLSFTDADGQFDLRELARLLTPAKEYDVVCGFRIDRRDHWTRKLYSRGYNLIVRTLLGTRVRDCDCALKIFRRSQIEALGLESNGFFINAELLAKARMAGLTVAEVGVNHFPRLRGESKVSIWHILPVLRTLLAFWWSKVMFSSSPTPAHVSVGRQAKWLGGVLLALAAGTMFFSNRSYPLIDPDESRYAEISREMVESGDYVVPTRLGKPYLDKPPLLYWLTAGSYRLFGVSESSARLVPALAAFATVAAACGLGARLLGPAAAWLGGMTMLSSAGFLFSGRFVFIDTLLTLFVTIGLLAGYLATRGEKLHRLWWLLAALACGLGILAKGPIAIALCVPPLVASRWLNGQRAIRVGQWLLFGGVVGLVALPWFVAIGIREPKFLVDFLWTHHVSRFVSGLSHSEPWWYYIPVVLVGMLPCSILFPAVCTFLFDRGPTTRAWRSRDLGFLVLSAAWMFMLFSVSSCKLPPYLLPAVPSLCLVIGRALEPILAGQVDNRYLSSVRRRSPHHLIAIFWITALGAAGADLLALGGTAAGHLPYWLALIALGGLGVIASRTGLLRRGLTPWIVAAGICVCDMAMATLGVFPDVAQVRSKVDPVVKLCSTAPGEAPPVVCFSLSHEADSLAFRLGGHRLQSYDFLEIDRAAEDLTRSNGMIVLANVNEIKHLREHLPQGLTIAEIGQYEHIFVGVCQSHPELADRASP